MSADSIITLRGNRTMLWRKVIEFYVRDLFPKKVKSVPRDQLGKVIGFPKDKPIVASKRLNAWTRSGNPPGRMATSK